MLNDNPRLLLNIHLTLPMVIAYLRAIATAEPDRIGQDGTMCIYAKQVGAVLTPVCIMGQMFANIGLLRLLMVNPSDLDSPSNPDSCAVATGFWTRLAEFGITATPEAQQFCHDVQRQQDEGTAWGQAFTDGVTDFKARKQTALEKEFISAGI